MLDTLIGRQPLNFLSLRGDTPRAARLGDRLDGVVDGISEHRYADPATRRRHGPGLGLSSGSLVCPFNRRRRRVLGHGRVTARGAAATIRF